MCEFSHLLASIQDAMDIGDNTPTEDFLVQEKRTEQENEQRVVSNGGDAPMDKHSIPVNSIEPDDGYEMDRSHNKERI